MSGDAPPVPVSGGTAEVQDGKETSATGGSPIDVARLADKVYQLLRAEARIGRARTESVYSARRTAED